MNKRYNHNYLQAHKQISQKTISKLHQGVQREGIIYLLKQNVEENGNIAGGLVFSVGNIHPQAQRNGENLFGSF